MRTMTTVTAAFIILLSSSLSFCKPPYLVFLPLSKSQMLSPAKVFQDHEYIESLPIDGIAMACQTVVAGDETVPYCIWSNKESLEYAHVVDEIAPLKGTFSKLNRSWLMGLTTMKTGDWFDDWSPCLRNFATAAKACKDLGLEGILLNNANDQYHRVPVWEYQPGVSLKSRDEYRRQVRLRGRQIMAACVQAYPAFKLALIFGPPFAEQGDPVIQKSGSYDLLSAFYSGLVAGAGEEGMVIDASVFYHVKERETFAASYHFRRFGIPSSRHDSPNIPREDRALWPQRLKIGYGLCYGYTEEGMTNALMQCDYMCWYYNGADYLAPETRNETWFNQDLFPSLGAARSAATAPGVNNIASGVHFAARLGEETIRAIPGDTSFSYTLNYDNHTGSPESITYLKKPDWVKARANHATVSGVPPTTPRTDTLTAVIQADGKSDTLKLTIVTSTIPVPAESGMD